MIKPFKLIILLMSAICLKSAPLTSQDYIEIKHTGMEEKPIRPLFISTHKLDLTSRKDLLGPFPENSENYTKKQKEAIIQSNCDFVVTDKTTFFAIADFVNHHQSFFTNYINKNNGDYDDFAIIIDGKSYNIFYKLKKSFFDKLIVDLSSTHKDKNVIQKLRNY